MRWSDCCTGDASRVIVVLEIRNVNMDFGGVSALRDVSFSVDAGELIGVIGPNGSGKSTLVNVITGFYAPSNGDVRLQSDSIAGHSPSSIRRRGVVRTFQNLRLVNEMTVLENAMAGAYLESVADGGLRAGTALLPSSVSRPLV